MPFFGSRPIRSSPILSNRERSLMRRNWRTWLSPYACMAFFSRLWLHAKRWLRRMGDWLLSTNLSLASAACALRKSQDCRRFRLWYEALRIVTRWSSSSRLLRTSSARISTQLIAPVLFNSSCRSSTSSMLIFQSAWVKAASMCRTHFACFRFLYICSMRLWQKRSVRAIPDRFWCLSIGLRSRRRFSVR